MWEIYAYQNAESLFGIFNAAAAIHASGDYARTRAEFEARQPMGRLGKPEEIAALALHLASDESGFTTGQIHIIDGGWMT